MPSRQNPLYRLLNKDYHESFSAYTPRLQDFHALVSSRLPRDWEIHRNGIWFHCAQPPNSLPQQGWKIHVSATPANAGEVLRRVIEVLFARGDTNFKFALDMSVLFLLNGKNWSRGGSGKFITIYPPDNQRFLELLEQVDAATTGLRGPYVLSDRRYRESGVVFYRFGGMWQHEVLNVKGEKTPMLVGPDGSDVPDERRAYPVTPTWARDPLPIEAPENPDENGTLKNGRYQIGDVLNFSNSGGVYLGLDRETGRKVVIKEARPYVNAMLDGSDAVAMLSKEYRLLSLIADTGIAVKPIDFFPEWEHWFLVEEYIEGTTLGAYSARHNVLLRTRAKTHHYDEWYRDFRKIFIDLVKTLSILHSRNIVFGDLSTNNIMVVKGGAGLKLIDFEGAYEIGVDQPCTLYTPGFVSQKRLMGSAATPEDDYYSLGAVLLAYLFPVNGLFHLEPEAGARILAAIQKDTRIPKTVIEQVLALLQMDKAQIPSSTNLLASLNATPVSVEQSARTTDTREENYRIVLEGIVEHICVIADYSRKDRLFPADPKIFMTNPLSVAYGAAGVIYALQKVAGKVPQKAYDWIFSHKITSESYPPGLYLGLSGIAWSLLEIGGVHEAERLCRLAAKSRLLDDSSDIFYGKAGFGLANLRFFQETGDEYYLETACETGRKLLQEARKHERGCHWAADSTAPLGLAHGASGIGLFLLYLYLATKESKFLEMGRQALEFDLSFALETMDAGLSWGHASDAPSPLYPYWRYGSAGVGTVLLRFYNLLGGERYAGILEKIFIDADRKYASFPGRFIGLAGIGNFLLDMHQFHPHGPYLESARKAGRGLMHFKVERHGIAFPGDTLSRLSCDYGTGSAGIALFLKRLIDGSPNDFMLDSLFGSSLPNTVGTEELKFVGNIKESEFSCLIRSAN
jgi:class III lanthionine synthetase